MDDGTRRALAEQLFAEHAQGQHDGRPDVDCPECDLPSFDECEDVGLDGTLRTKTTAGPWTRADVERARDLQEAELALAGAVEHLRTVLSIAERRDIFAEYPRELPSFDELVFALRTVQLERVR